MDRPGDAAETSPPDQASTGPRVEARITPSSLSRPKLVVGIGASAGGLEALESLFRTVPPDTGIAFVVVQHLSPDFRSMMPELLRRYSPLEVVPLESDVEMQADTIYVLTPRTHVQVDGNRLVVQRREPIDGRFHPIDRLFESLAEHRERAAAVILSGTGSDGTLGIRAMHAAGGLVMVQSRDEARFDGMLHSAIDTGDIDHEVPTSGMIPILIEFSRDSEAGRTLVVPPNSAAVPEPLPRILALLKRRFDIDFSHYKPGTILRRMERRLHRNGDPIGLSEYASLIADDPDELERLFEDLLIGVTSFFRDESHFDTLRRKAIEPLVEALEPNDKLRVWVCACSTGEEAYSITILILEAFRARGKTAQLRVLASDIDARALRFASAGVYPEERVSRVPRELRDRYFVETDGQVKVTSALRQTVVFAPHDIDRDVPFTRIDLVSCRNLLIYLKPEAQTRALESLVAALRTGGALFLGESESPGELSSHLDTTDADARLYRKRGHFTRSGLRSMRIRTTMEAQPSVEPTLFHQVLEQYVPAGLLVNASGEVLHIYGEAGTFLRARPGRFRSDLNSLLPQGLRSAVTVAMRGAVSRGEPVRYENVEFVEDDFQHLAHVQVDPLAPTPSGQAHFLVRLQRAGEVGSGTPDVGDADEQFESQRLEHLEAELLQLRQRLQHTIEELEAANEELTAGNEELTAANEELQSTNEELNAVNEELYTVNAEYELKIRELNEVSADVRNLIQSTGIATLFLDSELRLRLFTPEAVDVFRVKPHDIGRELGDISMCGEDPSLYRDLTAALSESATFEDRELQWPDDRHYLRRIQPYQNENGKTDGLVLTYIDVTVPSLLRLEVTAQELRFRQTVESLPQLVWTCDADGSCDYLSRQWVEYTGIPEADQLGGNWLHQVHPDDRDRLTQKWLASVESGQPLEVEFRIRRHDGAFRWFLTRALPVHDSAGRIVKWFGSNTDIEDSRAMAAKLSASEGRLRAVYEMAPTAIWEQDWSAVIAELASLRASGVEDVAKHLNQHPEAATALLRKVVVKDVNRWAVHMFGVDSEDELLHSLESVYSNPRAMSAFVEGIAAVARGDHEFSIDTRLSKPGGGHVDVALSMNLPRTEPASSRVFVAAVDISRIKSAEAALSLQQARLQAIVDTAVDAILTIDEKGTIETANAATSRMFGYPTEALVGQNVRMLMPAPHHERHDDYLRAYRDTGVTKIIGIGRDLEGARKDGSSFPLHLAVSEIRVEGRRLFTGIMRDTTEITKAADDLRQQARLLEQSAETLQRNNLAQQQFIYIVSHDLREPINTIGNFGSLLRDDYAKDLPAEAREYLDYVLQGSERMRRLLDDLLAYVRLERAEVNIERVALDEVIADVRRDLDAAISQREATLSVPRPLPCVAGQRSLLQVLLQNLIDNASKFHDPARPPVVTVTSEERDGWTTLTVTDNGVGIPPDQIGRAFEMFRRLHVRKKYPGTGIGLAMTKKIVELHGGTISIDSRVDEGTRVHVTLPLSPTPSGDSDD